MATYIESLKKTSSGCFSVRVVKENYGRNSFHNLTSETIWDYDCNCMPIIDDYCSDEPRRQRKGEKTLIRLAKMYGRKRVVPIGCFIPN